MNHPDGSIEVQVHGVKIMHVVEVRKCFWASELMKPGLTLLPWLAFETGVDFSHFDATVHGSLIEQGGMGIKRHSLVSVDFQWF